VSTADAPATDPLTPKRQLLSTLAATLEAPKHPPDDRRGTSPRQHRSTVTAQLRGTSPRQHRSTVAAQLRGTRPRRHRSTVAVWPRRPWLVGAETPSRQRRSADPPQNNAGGLATPSHAEARYAAASTATVALKHGAETLCLPSTAPAPSRSAQHRSAKLATDRYDRCESADT
jgi:hypothetical protein